MFQETEHGEQFDLSSGASSKTIGRAGTFLGFLLLLLLAVVTAVHAINITSFNADTLPDADSGIFTAIRITGVILVELFAVVTAVLVMSHKLRASQKPAAMVLEGTWVIFAAINLISSFSIESGSVLPGYVSAWVTYGLPVSMLVVGVEFYIILRLDPEAGRKDERAELVEKFEVVKHTSTLEVLLSPQMASVVKQMTWQKLPSIVGRQLGLSDNQVGHLLSQAPELLDLNQNGIPDIQENFSGQKDTPILVGKPEELGIKILATGQSAPAVLPTKMTIRQLMAHLVGKYLDGDENEAIAEAEANGISLAQLGAAVEDERGILALMDKQEKEWQEEPQAKNPN